ncbi:hypothetical protein [Nocardia cyriacigeorgica]|nr:hypothetical protein [Nocardia cyriacigeorgica]
MTVLGQAAAEPMAWWQALITTVAIFAGAALVVFLLLGGRR